MSLERFYRGEKMNMIELYIFIRRVSLRALRILIFMLGLMGLCYGSFRTISYVAEHTNPAMTAVSLIFLMVLFWSILMEVLGVDK